MFALITTFTKMLLFNRRCGKLNWEREGALMSTRLPPLILLLLLCVNVCKLASSDLDWGTFSRGKCIKPGFRKYSARPEGEPTPVFLHNVYFPEPDGCNDKGTCEFFLRDPSCDPWWHQIKNEKCESPGFHKYSSWLEHIEGNWQGWCVQTTAVVRGIFFSSPTSCYTWFFHKWADFKVPDVCCRGPHDELSIEISSGKKLYNSEDGYMGVCAKPRSFAQWLELIQDGVALRREPERQTCPIAAGAEVEGRLLSSNIHNTELVDSKCMLKAFEKWRQEGRRAARSGDEDKCESDEDKPPFPILGDPITDFAGAVAEFGQHIIRTSRLLPFLFSTPFYTIVRQASASVSNFHANVMERVGPGGVTLQYLGLRANVPYPNLPNSEFQAMLVPTTPAEIIVDSGGLFPVGSYATIHVGQQPRPASVICTERFTGCTFAIGWDRTNRVLYMGHARPGGDDRTLSRSSLSNRMRMRGGFENVELDRERDIYFFGGDDMYYSYDTERANVIGFIYDTHVEVLFQVTTNDDDHIKKSWIIFYCADDDST